MGTHLFGSPCTKRTVLYSSNNGSNRIQSRQSYIQFEHKSIEWIASEVRQILSRGQRLQKTCKTKQSAPGNSAVRWLSPKSAKRCHENLLDPAKNLLTNFQLKSAKSSEILPKNLLFWGTKTCKAIYQFLVLQSLLVDKGRKCLSWPPHFSAHNFLTVDSLSNVTAAYLLCMTDRFWQYLPNVPCVYKTVLSNKQHSFSLTTF